MAVDPSSPRAFALSFISNPRFHQNFTIGATPTHGPLNVSYAEYGKEQNESQTIPTLLLMPGMFSSRYLGLGIHVIAEKLEVRLLVVDRPGMGKTTDVPLEQRMSVWIEIVPLLLAHLGIQHVALASHSAGTMYLLNTLYRCREILDPEKPMATFIAPFVDPAHSGMTSLKAAQFIPASAFKLWHHIPRLFLAQDGSATATSGAAVAKFSAMLSPSTTEQRDKNRRYIEENYGLGLDRQVEIDSAMMQNMFKEDTVGANSEALQCLRKKPDTWGVCEDYDVFVKKFLELEKERGRSGVPLKVQTYFAEEDSMSGKKGQAYFEKCWAQAEAGDLGTVLKFESTTIPGSDHDGLVQSAEVWERILKDVKQTVGGDS